MALECTRESVEQSMKRLGWCRDGWLIRIVVPPQTVKALTVFLTKMEAWVDDIPLQTSPQRFGNKAFRDWIAVMEEARPIAISP
jgi:hypothetical protein